MTASKFWALILGLIVAGGGLIGSVLYVRQHPDLPKVTDLLEVPSSKSPQPPAPASKPAIPSPKAPGIAKEEPAPLKPEPPSGPGEPPHFDVVRVEPSGEAVVAGKGAPDSKVALMASGKVVAEAQTDANGQFVILPPPLQPGDHDLSLRETPQGKAPVESKQNVAVSVPKKHGDQVVVALAEPGKPTKLLAGPPDAKPATPDAPTTDKLAVAKPETKVAPPAAVQPAETGLAIRTVELENGNGFFATGVATPGTHIEVYLNGSHLTQVVAGPDRQWTVTLKKGLAGGHYAVRADAIEGRSVVARVEVPFDVPEAMAQAPTAAAKPTEQAAQPPKPAAAPTEVAKNEPEHNEPDSSEPDKSVAKPVEEAAVPPVEPSPAPTPRPDTAARAEADVAAAPKIAPPTLAVAPPAKPEPQAAPPAAQTYVAPATPKAAPPALATAEPTVAPPKPPAIAGSPAPVTSNAVVEQVETAKVINGDNLWDISRTRLGNGMRYTQIYAANVSQIRNPNLIYPGQVFVMPQP